MRAMRGFGLGLRSHYVIAFGMLGSVMPYVSLFLRAERGLTDSQIGWVHAETTVGLMLAPVVTTHLADRVLSNRALMGLTYALGALGMAMLAVAESFASTALAFLMFSLTMASMIPLLNGLAMAALDERPEGATGLFHRTRVWGTIGFIVPSVGLFALLRWTEVSTSAAMWMGSAIAVLGMVSIGGLPAHGGRNGVGAMPRAAGAAVGAANGRGGLPSVRAARLLFSRQAIGFTLGVFGVSMAGAIFFAFYPLYLDALGVADQWVGLIFNIGVFAEIACILYVGKVRERIGLRGIMLVGTAAGVLRMVLLALAPSVWTAVLSQLLHAPMILTIIFVPVVYLNALAEPDFRNSVQGLYTMVCRGMPRLFGSPLAGYLSVMGAASAGAVFGMQLAFGLAAVLMAVALVVMLVLLREAE